MKNPINFIVLAFILTIMSCQSPDQITLVDRGSSEYQIVISDKASVFEKEAALEFQKILEEVSNVKIKLVTDEVPTSELEVLIGKTNRKEFLGISKEVEGLDEDGFIIKTIGKKLLISGGVEKGHCMAFILFLKIT